MPRTPKGVRHGGRSKGTPNKKTVLLGQVRSALEQEGCDPAVIMAKIALAKIRGEHVDVRLRAAAELLQYIAPKYTRVELSGPNAGPVQMEMFESAGDRVAGILGRIASRGEGGAVAQPDAEGTIST